MVNKILFALGILSFIVIMNMCIYELVFGVPSYEFVVIFWFSLAVFTNTIIIGIIKIAMK